jgi:hypothetical protein
LTIGGLTSETLAFKLICFGANGVNIIQFVNIGVTQQIQMDYAFHMQGIHCMAH